MSRLRTLLADDHTLVRAGLRKLLESIPDVEVVGEASDGLMLLQLALQLQPQLVLMDIAMPGLNGLETTARLMRQQPDVRVIILSMHQNEEYVRQALRNGAVAYLLKDAATLELELAVKAVLRGETYLSPAVSRGIVSDYVQRLRADDQPGDSLTPRQREVLQLVAEGHAAKSVADLLNISQKTVEFHKASMMRQLGLRSSAELIRYAINHGLVEKP